MDDAPLFRPPTSHAALDKAARAFGSRRVRILQLLGDDMLGPSTIFEIAAAMELHDHQISGRFTELEADGLIVKTGHRKPKPETGCDAEVYRLAVEGEFPGAAGTRIDLGQALHHPDTLKVGDEGLFQRLPWTAHEGMPGVPYARPTSSALPRVTYWLQLIECTACGRPVQLKMQGQQKTYACPACGKQYKLMLVNEPGKAEMLALVATHL